MKQNINTPIDQEKENLASPNLLASFCLLSKNLGISDPIITGISFPIFETFSGLYEIMKNDPQFRSKFSLFTMNKTRIINVVEAENLSNNAELLFEDIYSINNDVDSPVLFQVITISYLDLINNKDIMYLLTSENASEFGQHIFYFENCTWIKIKNMLAANNITLTVGSNTRRQFLSPIEYKFSLFLICLGFTLEDISKFFLNYEQNDKNQIKIAMNKNKMNNKNNQKNSSFTKPGNKREFSTSLSSSGKVKLPNKDHKFNSKNLIIKGERKREINFNSDELKLTDSKNHKEVDHPDLLLKDSLLLTFLEDLGKLVTKNLNNEEELIKLQRQIEDDWVKNVIAKLNDPKYLNHNTNKTIKKAFESLQIFSTNKKQLNKLFGLNGIELVKIEHVIVAFATILTNILNLKNKTLYTNLAGKVGLSVLTHFYWSNKKHTSTYVNFNLFLVGEAIDNEKQVLLGDIFIERFIDIGMLNRFHGDTKQVYLEINKEYISKLADSTIISPPSLPMICKPLIWSENTFGGYLKNATERRDLITGSTFKHGHKIENRHNLYQAINYFNNIKFRVNNELLTYLEKDGQFLLEYLINKEIENTVYPEGQTNKNKNNKIKLAKLNIDITLKIANVYSKIPFYLPTNADWRGRVYTSSFFLSYQGSDFSNGLIQFWDGDTLTKEGLDNLYIYGANSYNENGINKKSLDTRIKWVIDNYNRILEMDKEFILKADSPLVFTAFCLNLIQLEKDSNTKIFTPIFLDATCSGIQHFAGLLKDYDLGSKVNLIAQNDNDVVGDIYSFILDPVNNEINKFGIENSEFSHFTSLKLERKDIKQPTMTKLYNVTIYGMKEQLKSNFDSIKAPYQSQDKNENNLVLLSNYEYTMASEFASNFDKVFKKNSVFYKAPGKNKAVLLSSKDLYQIAKIINNTIFELFPSLKVIYDYLIRISEVLAKAKLPISWNAPSGLQITQNYLKSEVHKASIKSGNVAKTIVMRQTNRNKVDNRKQKQAIIPNVIHSLDASHLINLVATANTINLIPIITIHDCFGTSPNKMGLVHNLVLKEFISLYTKGDFLQNFQF